jgi:hypothetical protein
VIFLGLGREIFKAVLIATLSTAFSKAIEYGIDELKEYRKNSNKHSEGSINETKE